MTPHAKNNNGYKRDKGRFLRSDPCRKYVRRRPTLPHSPPCSTIGAERLSFRVRNGAGRFPFAMAAETLWRYIGVPAFVAKGGNSIPDRISGTAQWTRVLLVPNEGQRGGSSLWSSP